MSERLAHDIARDLRAQWPSLELLGEAADKIEGLIELLTAAELDRDKARAEIGRLKASRMAVGQLLHYVYVLRAHGEGVDGGSETWREFDRRLEAFLQATVGAEVAGDE